RHRHRVRPGAEIAVEGEALLGARGMRGQRGERAAQLLAIDGDSERRITGRITGAVVVGKCVFRDLQHQAVRTTAGGHWLSRGRGRGSCLHRNGRCVVQTYGAYVVSTRRLPDLHVIDGQWVRGACAEYDLQRILIERTEQTSRVPGINRADLLAI